MLKQVYLSICIVIKKSIILFFPLLINQFAISGLCIWETKFQIMQAWKPFADDNKSPIKVGYKPNLLML